MSADKTVGAYSDEWDTDDTPDLDDPVPVATQPLLVTELPEPRYDRPCTVHQAWPNDDFRCEAPRCPGSYAAHGERPAS